MHKFVLLNIILISGILFAENPESKKDTAKVFNLSEVVVTATKIATPSIEVASSVTVLNEADIEKSQKTYVADVLRDVPGLSIVQQGGPGKVTRVFIRGANPHHTLVLIDGVEMSDPSSVTNAYDLSNLPTDDIEKIEILRGPQSTLYGSDAMAGVISIFTKKGKGKPELSLSGEGGSYNTFKGNALFGW